MKLYRRKIDLVEADQWFPGRQGITGVCYGCGRNDYLDYDAPAHVHMEAQKVTKCLLPGDWVILSNDEFVVLSNEVFEQTYEKIEDENESGEF